MPREKPWPYTQIVSGSVKARRSLFFFSLAQAKGEGGRMLRAWHSTEPQIFFTYYVASTDGRMHKAPIVDRLLVVSLQLSEHHKGVVRRRLVGPFSFVSFEFAILFRACCGAGLKTKSFCRPTKFRVLSVLDQKVLDKDRHRQPCNVAN